MNSWLKIIEAFMEGRFPGKYYGPSPRFLIGACQIPVGKKFETSESAYEATKLIFGEMQTFNKDGIIVVSIACGDLDGPVMSLSSSKWSKLSMGISFEEIWDRYGEEITNGDYHIDAAERKTIEEIFQN